MTWDASRLAYENDETGCRRLGVHGLFWTDSVLVRRALLLMGGLALALAALLGHADPTEATSSATVNDAGSISVAVEALSDAAVLRGRDASPLIEHHYVTRAELLACLGRALEPEDPAEPVHADFFRSVTGLKVIVAAHKAGLADGTIPHFFEEGFVSREEALSWIVACLDSRIAGLEAAASTLESIGLRTKLDSSLLSSMRLSSLGDADEWLGGFQDRMLIDPSHAPAVANAYRLRVIDASADGWLYPDMPLTWGDMAVMLHRAFFKLPSVLTVSPVALPAQETYPTLTEGAEGPLVWYAEYQLAALKYRPGVVDGVYDYRTSDAVLAFQKVERLKRDGIAGASFWERIFAAATPTPRRTDVGTRVEVDISRQVLLMITDNEVWKIVHVSTGKGGGTPTGRGTVGVKQTGWNPTPVGSMYYVSYIMPHIAIHGMPSVPVYPASHGCIRVPMWMAVELFYELPKGTRVDLYYNEG